MPEVLSKIAELRDEIRRRRLDVAIQADGGVSVETMPLLVDVGVTVFVAGSAVLGKQDVSAAIQRLRAIAGKASS